MTPERGRELLRWYPRAWRDRYGDELLALVEDYCDGGRLRLRDRIDLFRIGLLMRRRPKSRAHGNDRRLIASRVVSCAAAFAAMGALSAGAASAHVAQPSTHQVMAASERGAAVAGIGGAAVGLTVRRSK